MIQDVITLVVSAASLYVVFLSLRQILRNAFRKRWITLDVPEKIRAGDRVRLVWDAWTFEDLVISRGKDTIRFSTGDQPQRELYSATRIEVLR